MARPRRKNIPCDKKPPLSKPTTFKCNFPSPPPELCGPYYTTPIRYPYYLKRNIA